MSSIAFSKYIEIENFYFQRFIPNPETKVNLSFTITLEYSFQDQLLCLLLIFVVVLYQLILLKSGGVKSSIKTDGKKPVG